MYGYAVVMYEYAFNKGGGGVNKTYLPEVVGTQTDYPQANYSLASEQIPPLLERPPNVFV